MKGASEIITAVMLLGVTVVSSGVVLEVTGPAIDNIQDDSAVDRSVSFLNFADERVREVASEGEGSTRTVQLDLDRGEFEVNSSEDTFGYSLQTGSASISPQSQTTIGSVQLASNAGVEVNEETINGEDCYLMENDKVEACIKNVGSEDNITSINSSELMTYYNVKESGEMDLDFKVELNEDSQSSHGEGYTYAEELGSNKPYGTVWSVINAENNMNYRISFRLYSGADFVSIRVLPQQ